MDYGAPTDRGYVVITKLDGGGYRVEVCEKVSRAGDAINVYAAHHGVPEVVVRVRGGLSKTGKVQSTREPAEVYNDQETGKLNVSSMPDWSKLDF